MHPQLSPYLLLWCDEKQCLDDQEAIEAVMVEEQLQKVPSFISKVIQVYTVHG